MTDVQNRSIALWLFISAASVFAMAIIGAITRLTESGLSIVEWNPVMGALPPLNESDWQREFDLYKQSPQYIKVNHGMTLDEFKNIYFWEWFHRLWGRIIGLIYALPLVYFWRQIPRDWRPRFVGILLLGGCQGAMGWYMVKSGLVDAPAVSHYRLAAHLMLAFLIYACLVRLGLCFWSKEKPVNAWYTAKLSRFSRGTTSLAVLTMIWGAFTAGLDAGMVYNTFPKMDQHWLPPEIFAHQPIWRGFFEDPAVVQFTHRLLALLTFCKISVIIYYVLRHKIGGEVRKTTMLLAAAITLQIGLGIATVLTQVNLVLATLHQGGALVLLTALMLLLHNLPRSQK